MKIIVYLFSICSVLVLAGCTEENAVKEKVQVSQEPVLTEQEISTEKNSSIGEEQPSTGSQSKENKTKKEITPDNAEKVVRNLVKTAQDDQIVYKIEIEDSKDEVTANITFNEEISDEQQRNFLFNYLLFLEKQYPEQEVKVNIQ